MPPPPSPGVPPPNEPGCPSPYRDESQFRRTNEMRDSIEAKGVQIENVACNSSPWEPRAALAPNDALGVQTLYARSVELVAQPGKIRELGSCVRGVLMDHLKKQRGFAGVIVLS